MQSSLNHMRKVMLLSLYRAWNIFTVNLVMVCLRSIQEYFELKHILMLPIFPLLVMYVTMHLQNQVGIMLHVNMTYVFYVDQVLNLIIIRINKVNTVTRAPIVFLK